MSAVRCLLASVETHALMLGAQFKRKVHGRWEVQGRRVLRQRALGVLSGFVPVALFLKVKDLLLLLCCFVSPTPENVNYFEENSRVLILSLPIKAPVGAQHGQ
jgi:hypothetical protein